MTPSTRALAVTAVAILLAACTSDIEPLGPTPVDAGVVVFVHTGFTGSSQQISADVTNLGKVEGPCGDGEGTRTWDDCISSVRVLPGWRATLYGDRDFRGATLELTEDAADLSLRIGSCSGSYNDCISSIRVSRR
jgi:hypothetical protein